MLVNLSSSGVVLDHHELIQALNEIDETEAMVAEAKVSLVIERERNPHRVTCPRCAADLPIQSRVAELERDMDAQARELMDVQRRLEAAVKANDDAAELFDMLREANQRVSELELEKEKWLLEGRRVTAISYKGKNELESALREAEQTIRNSGKTLDDETQALLSRISVLLPKDGS